MKVKDIIFIQNAIHSAKDFIYTNIDSDETETGSDTIKELDDSLKKLQKEKEAIYLRNAKVNLKKIKH
jgi:hypothetical protein